MQHALTLVVVALLQLCRAEISEALPEWYSVNLIKDPNYQPKPITEIFTTPATISSTNPNLISSTTTFATDDVFTLPTTTSETTSTKSPPFTEDSMPRFVTPEQNTTTVQRNQEERRQRQMYQSRPEQIQVLIAQPPQIQPEPQLEAISQVKYVPQLQNVLQAQPIPQKPPTPQIPSAFQPQQISTLQSTSQQQSTGQPNYFLIYQQAPLSIQQYPESGSQLVQNSPSTFQTSRQQPITQTITQEATRTTVTQPTVIIRELRTENTSTTLVPEIIPRNRDQPLLFTSPPLLFGGPWPNPSISPGEIFSRPPISSTIILNRPSTPEPNGTILRLNRTTPTALPQRSNIPPLTIRVTVPRGSVTNIKINPSTSTKKPSTRRSQRRKGNNYNACVDACKGKKEPICGAPLAVIPIDPNKLRGFPSICHLACHNSFRKNQPFEKIMDGKCSRLRTRIRTFDKNKLRREELNKTQYTVLSNSQDPVVQIIPNESLSSKHY